MTFYILEGETFRPAKSMEEYLLWLVMGNRHVAQDLIYSVRIKQEITVSTVFLGVDHQFGEGPPLLFECRIFGGVHHEYRRRCSTFEQAKEMHNIAVALAKGELN